jgi:hypothetical protein
VHVYSSLVSFTFTIFYNIFVSLCCLRFSCTLVHFYNLIFIKNASATEDLVLDLQFQGDLPNLTLLSNNHNLVFLKRRFNAFKTSYIYFIFHFVKLTSSNFCNIPVTLKYFSWKTINNFLLLSSNISWQFKQKKISYCVDNRENGTADRVANLVVLFQIHLKRTNL